MPRKLKAGLTRASKTPNEVQVRDTFETPKYAVDLLIPFIPKNISWIWECACGNGRIVQRLKERGFGVYPSDIRKSTGWVNNHIHNFLTDERPLAHYFSIRDEAIITNPPFSVKDLFIEKAFEYDVPFAFLVSAEYSGKTIDWIRRGCQKIIPTSRIAYITPNILRRIHEGETWKHLEETHKLGLDIETWKGYSPKLWSDALEFCKGFNYNSIDDTPQELLYKYSSAQFHSMWLTYKFDLPSSEVFVDLPVKVRKENIR